MNDTSPIVQERMDQLLRNMSPERKRAQRIALIELGYSLALAQLRGGPPPAMSLKRRTD